MERYKILYSNNNLVRVVEVTNASGILLETPVVHSPSDGDWGSFLSGIASCASTSNSLEVVQSCLFDNTTEDYLNLVPFIRYSTLNTQNGDVTYLGDYKNTSSGIEEYTVIGTPVNDPGSQPLGNQCRRNVLTGSQTWTLASNYLTQRLQVVHVSGAPSISDANGTVTTLYAGENIQWEISQDGAGLLVDDLTISANSGVVAVTWTELKL